MITSKTDLYSIKVLQTNPYKDQLGARRAFLLPRIDDTMKDFAAAFYKSKAWQQCRAAYLEQTGGLCEDCLAKGIYKPAEIVHHIVEIDPVTITNPEITLNFSNLRAVCRECHAAEHGARIRRYKVDELGRVKLT